MKQDWMPACAGMTIFILPLNAAAHGFGQLYNLPVPFWLYAWGAGSALALSFVVVGFFATSAPAAPSPAGAQAPIRPAHWAARAFAVFLLLLTIATALVGTRDPYRNFSMTFFWIVFVLMFAYLTAFIGDLWSRINPWHAIADAIGRAWTSYTQGRVRYPQWLGDWPALALYLAFIWFELFGLGRPRPLGHMLAAYTAINLAGVWLVGSRAWFRHCEFFSVFFRLIALLAPRRWRPCAGIVEERPASLSTVVFAMAMLSTTAFDGLRATQWWVGLFWNDPFGIVTAVAGDRPIMLYAKLRAWYVGWETFWLVISPFLYFGVYVLFVALAKLVTRSPRPLRELALDFGYTLLPIALVYNVTHYATLILTQGVKVVSLASDPFGLGWNVLGTLTLFRRPILPPMGLVWHTQVALILVGHIVSVYLAHLIALRIWPTRGQAVVSQLPMLVLMVGFTVAGLWILAQPLTAMLMR